MVKEAYVIFHVVNGKRTQVKCVVTTYKQAKQFMDLGYESICTYIEDPEVLLDPPTDKQLSFIQGICECLDISNPHCSSKDEARQFISDHIREYEMRCLDQSMECEILNG